MGRRLFIGSREDAPAGFDVDYVDGKPYIEVDEGGARALARSRQRSRVLVQSVPENAINISDPSEAPPGAQTVQGPRGGWYYLPSATTAGTDAPDQAPPEGGGEKEALPVAPELQRTADDIRSAVEAAGGDRKKWREPVNEIVVNTLGVDSVDFQIASPETIIRTVQELQLLDSLGAFEGVRAIQDYAINKPQSRGANGAYDPGSDTLYLFDRRTDHERRLVASLGLTRAARHYTAGHQATSHPLGTLHHEIGHSRHLAEGNPALRNRGPYDPPLTMSAHPITRFAQERYPRFDDWKHALAQLLMDVSEEVSRYSVTLPTGEEVVAEVHAGLLGGEEYPGWVMELYDALGGPEVTDEMIQAVAAGPPVPWAVQGDDFAPEDEA